MSADSRFGVLRPRTAAAAVELAANTPSCQFVAGGTALQLDWAQGATPPRTLIALDGIPALRGTEMRGADTAGDTVRIGALTPLAALERDPRIQSALPLLSDALRDVAAPSIRNLATLGGNVAGRRGCLLPALLALDATLTGVNASGSWRRPLRDWLSDPARAGDLLDAIELPTLPHGCRWTHRKIGLRAAFTPSVIGVAGLLLLDQGQIVTARLAVGGGLVPPSRLPAAEALLLGRAAAAVDWSALHACLVHTIAAPDDVFRTARYRRLVAANALVHGLGGPLPPLRRRALPRTPAPTTAHVPAPAAANAPDSVLPGEIHLSHNSQPARWHVRPDGAAKVSGSLRYLTDHRTEGMLVGRILRAAHAHARILSIDTSRAAALPGVVAVVTHRDVPGLNGFGIVIQDQPALCHDKVRYLGDAVAAVAASDDATAEAALGLIDVCYEPLPVVTDVDAALFPDSPRVHDAGNLQRLIEYSRGDVLMAFAACAHVIDDVYVTPRQMHGFLETEGGWAALDTDGTLAMHAGGQHGQRDRQQLARLLAWPEERIRVVTSPTGGAFGGKDELTVQPALALLALKSRRPVRLQLSRTESTLAGTKRHPMVIRMRTGCDAEGRILAQEVDVLADAGAYASLGPSVLETALEHAAGTYEIANVKTRGRLVYTNNGVGGAFRGFGANQMTYAVECQIDRLAARCGLSPLELRRRNLKRADGLGYFGQAVAPSDRLAAMWSAAAASPLWNAATQPHNDDDVTNNDIIGVGMAMNHHGNGLGSVIPDAAAGRLRLGQDGMIEARFTLDEMGQGLLPLVLAVVSEELGCGREDIRPIFGDTANAPDSGSTTASRGTHVVWRVTRLAAPAFSAQLRTAAAKLLEVDPAEFTLGPGGLRKRLAPEEIAITYRQLADGLSTQPPPHPWPSVDSHFEYPKTDYAAGNARFIFVTGACIARVALCRITGQIRVLELDQRTAAGPVVDVASYLGQQEGGAVQGIGFTLTEEAAMRDGVYLTDNFDGYMMPSIADAPSMMDVYALEELDAGDSYGPRGVGELGIGAVTPAIANAVLDALGVCPATSPISPEWILDAMAPPP